MKPGSEEAMEELHTIFVYGTLRRDARDGSRMAGAVRLGPAVVPGVLYFVPPYPALVLDRTTGHSVVGEVWKVTSRHLAELEAFVGRNLEEAPYRRVRAKAFPREKAFECGFDQDSEIDVWVWEWQGDYPPDAFVLSGDWLDIERPRQPPLFTSIGCVGLLSLPIGGAILASLVFAVAPVPVMSDKAEALYGMIQPVFPLGACALGWFSLKMIRVRREPGKRFQEWLAFGTGMMLLFGVLGVIVSVVRLLML